MAWKAPAGFGGMTSQGRSIASDDGGFVDLSVFEPEIAHRIAADLIAHGFTVVDDAPPPPPGAGDVFDAMKRQELFAFLRERSVKIMPPIGNNELRRLARGAAMTGADDPSVRTAP